MFRLWMLMVLGASVAYAADVPQVHQGLSSFYAAKGAGACALDEEVGNPMVVAINRKDFNKAAMCGAYLHIMGAKGEAVVRVVDICPGCKAGGLDLNKPAFAKVADIGKGRDVIRWELASPSITTPVQYHFKSGSSGYWTGIQIRNHRNPIAKLEYRKADGTWASIARSPYNYFVQKSPSLGTGPYTFRLTDFYGNILIDQDIPLKSGGTVSGAAQFPALNMPVVVSDKGTDETDVLDAMALDHLAQSYFVP